MKVVKNQQQLISLIEDSEANFLYKSYQAAMKDIQKKCKHKNITDWENEYWAFGKSTARRIRLCLNCRKEVDSQIACSECFDYFPDDKIIKGVPGNIHLCKTCYPVGVARQQAQARKLGEWCSVEGVYKNVKISHKCSKCSDEAMFYSPAKFCRLHWVQWWVDEMKPSPENREKMISEINDQMKREE